MEVAVSHPLQLGRVDSTLERTMVTEDDPLRAQGPAVTHKQFVKIRTLKRTKSVLDEQMENAALEWDAYKQVLLQKFASSGAIAVSSNLSVTPKGKARGLTRLQSLDDPEMESKEEKTIITQQEYIAKLKELKHDIAEAWESNERAAALRMSLKMAKLLSDTSVPNFYPALFILVTDALDSVGDLVWNRIKQRAEEGDSGSTIVLPDNFSAKDIHQEAKRTCNNWFLKIGSTKELLPRIYLEIAILKCVHFLEEGPPVSSFRRLSMMIRGLGDPLASAYAYIYLSRKGRALVPREIGYLVNGIHDFTRLFQKTSSEATHRRNYGLVEPMFEWIVSVLFKHMQQEDIGNVVFSLCGENEQRSIRPLSVLIHYVIKHLPSIFISNNAMEVARLVLEFSDASKSQHLNFIVLGKKLCDCPPPRELRTQLLKDVWEVISEYTSLDEYMSVADAFTEYVVQCCTETEIVFLLRNIHSRLDPSADKFQVLRSFESIVIRLLGHYTDLEHVLALNSFVDIIDVFHGEPRVNVYKVALSMVSKNGGFIADPVTRHFCLNAAKVLHDSLDILSSDDERRQISRLVMRYVQLAHFADNDLEQHLDFLVECRASFSSMDMVKVQVVHISNRLAVMALKLAGGHLSKEGVDFVKACATFNEITIPSMTSAMVRAQLFVESAEVALMNELFSHTQSLLKSGITCLEDISLEEVKGVEEELVSLLQKLCSFVILSPDDPELGALYFFTELLNFLDAKPRLLSAGKRKEILCGLQLAVSSVSHQNESNDASYHRESTYWNELSSFARKIQDSIAV